MKALAIAQLFGKHAGKGDYVPVLSYSVKDLAELTRINIRTLRRFLQKLVQMGFLIQVKNRTRGGKQQIYIATFPDISRRDSVANALDSLRRFRIKYEAIIEVLSDEFVLLKGTKCPIERDKMSYSGGSTYINPRLTFDLGVDENLEAKENEPKNLYPGLPGFVKKELSDWHESKSKPKTINTKTKKAAYRSSTPKKPKCKIEALLLRLNTKLTQAQINDLVRIWSVYKPALALPHLEAKLRRFNKAKWYPKALHAAWRDDGLVWHDADVGRYRTELIFGYNQGPHDEESYELVLKDREKLKAYEAARKTPRKKYVKPPQVIKEPTPQKSWQVTMTFGEADEFQDLVETTVTRADSQAEAVERVRGWHDRTPINTIVTEVTI